MLRQQPAKKVVIETLNKPTLSNPNKTYAEAMIDQTITKGDLVAINTTTAFPANNYNRLNLPEGSCTD